MVNIKGFTPGDIVYDVHRELGCWTATVHSVDLVTHKVVASHEGRFPRALYARGAKLSWRRTKPAMVG